MPWGILYKMCNSSLQVIAEKSSREFATFFLTMEQTTQKSATILSQSRALMMKNLILQKHDWFSNVVRFVFLALTLLTFAIVERKLKEIKALADQAKQQMTTEQKYLLAHPIKQPSLIQIPPPEFRATRGNNISDPSYHPDLPRGTCRAKGTCPLVTLFTGMNRTTAEKLGQSLYGSEILAEPSKPMDMYTAASKFTMGTYPDDDEQLYVIQQSCNRDFTFQVSLEIGGETIPQDVKCVKGLQLWRKNYGDMVRELSNSYSMGKNSKTSPNEFFGAYDFLNTDDRTFNVTVWYDPTKDSESGIVRAINAASNSYLQYFRGSNVQLLFEFVKSMPKEDSDGLLDTITSIVSAMQPIFFMCQIASLFPVILQAVVYEKQNKLRMIMKMHGLGDFPYWLISYAFYLLLSSAYILFFLLLGFVFGLKLFVLNDGSAQFLFYFVYINVQISSAILLSTTFSDVRTASVIGTIYILGGGIVALISTTIGEAASGMKDLRAIPIIALYKILSEFTRYSDEARLLGETRSTWSRIASDKDGLLKTLIIMVIEWPVFLLVGYYTDQVAGNGSGVRKHPLWFFPCFQRRSNRYEQRHGHEILVSLERSDVSQETERVKRLLQDSVHGHKIIVDDLKKSYPRRDGNPVKHAVRGLSLAIAEGECFGMLGPNGAGKTSFISMMTGLTTPTSGTAFIDGLDIREDMDVVYTKMGVCPQHDLLWEVLTGREHLYFYGRLKRLTGASLALAVEDSLASVSLTEKGNTRVGRYSGGMKRRLSVAISLIGDPIAVYMDEPSTGLDPASRKTLWSAVEKAKKKKSIILTTHSMEEAEFLCDRVGIFVDGGLQCIGSPKELRERYGGYFLLTIATPVNQEEDVEKLVRGFCPAASKVYHIAGTQKYHLPKQDVTVAGIFRDIEHAKGKINIQDWGLSTATLEDAFLKVASIASS